MLEYTFLLGGYTDAATQGIYRIRYNPTQELFSTAELVSASHNPSIGLKMTGFGIGWKRPSRAKFMYLMPRIIGSVWRVLSVVARHLAI